MSFDLLRKRYPKVDRTYHFTERANVPSLKKHGILSLREIHARGLAAATKFCSSAESRSIDQKRGLDQYVRLCFAHEHPMEYRARERGDMVDPVFVHVDVGVLDLPDVLVASGVPYQAGVQIYPLEEAIETLDFEVLFTWMDWHVPEISHRRQSALKYEILIPKRVDPGFILWP